MELRGLLRAGVAVAAGVRGTFQAFEGGCGDRGDVAMRIALIFVHRVIYWDGCMTVQPRRSFQLPEDSGLQDLN